MKHRMLQSVAWLQAALIVLLLAYIGWLETQAPAQSVAASSADVSVVAAPDTDVVWLTTPPASDEPAVLEIPRLESWDVYDDNKDPAILREILQNRLALVGLSFSNRALDKVGEELDTASFMAYCNLYWVNYKDFDLLIPERPDAVDRGDTCHVFEHGQYKGYIPHWGNIDPANCFVPYQEDIWLSASTFGHGSGFACEDVSWYRLTSPGLDCELRYTKQLRQNAVGTLEVNYQEEFVELVEGQYGLSVCTAWTERIDDGQGGELYQFTHTGESKYALQAGRLWEPYSTHTFGSDPYYLTVFRTEFEQLTRTGTPAQQESLLRYLDRVMSKKKIDEIEGLSSIAQWYKNTTP